MDAYYLQQDNVAVELDAVVTASHEKAEFRNKSAAPSIEKDRRKQTNRNHGKVYEIHHFRSEYLYFDIKI